MIIGSAQQTPRIFENTNIVASYGNLLDDFALGQPANDIVVGISKRALPSDIFVCLFYIGQTNSNQLWIAPPQFQRVDYFLYDSSNQAVSYSRTYNPANKTYKLISEVPKNVFNVYEGLMGAPFTMPYDQVVLTNVFQIVRAGDYKLVARGRIMKINNDGTLRLVEFPPASLTIHIDDEDETNKAN